MGTSPLKRWRGYLFMAIGTVLVLGVLFVFSRTVENSGKYGKWWDVILPISIIGVLVLAGLLVRRIYLLVRDYRAHVPGSRLAARTVATSARWRWCRCWWSICSHFIPHPRHRRWFTKESGAALRRSRSVARGARAAPA